MKMRDKNPLLSQLVRETAIRGRETPLWGAAAHGLNRPRRRSVEVNLSSLEKHASPKETVLVPGTVLGEGELTKPLTVAAARFSGAARAKILKAGGRTLTIQELQQSIPSGKGVRVIG